MHKLIDTHAHLDELEHLDEAIEKAKSFGVTAIAAVGSDYESNNRVLEIAARYSPYIYPALGLHPSRLGTDEEIQRTLRFVEDNINSISAVGEIGLDYHKRVLGLADKERQKGALRDVLGLARRYGKPALMHTRYAWRDSLTLVAESRVVNVVFHWFTGPSKVLVDLLDAGYHVSATPAAGYHAEHIRIVKETPLERLLLETDSPVVYRMGTELGRESEPADVIKTLVHVASIKQVDPEIVARTTTENALWFYGTAPSDM
ncbi:TatD family hydrolase [Chloroflexota bacterium]